jgi:hypothetical protein
LIVLLAGTAIWGGLHFLKDNVKIGVTDSGKNKKEVSIKTPFGAVQVNKNAEVSEASLGLPIYPGAELAKDEDSASVSLALPGNNGLRIVGGKFQTSDSFDKVRDFYQDTLTARDGSFTRKADIGSDHDDLSQGDTGNFVGVTRDGKMVFKIKQKESERVVALIREPAGTRIELVRIAKNAAEPN